jgi:hypothetical protein
MSEGYRHEQTESKAEKAREYGSKKSMGACKVNCQYPTGTIPTAKVSMGAQKTNPARRNRSY